VGFDNAASVTSDVLIPGARRFERNGP
jgi:hypothetical protein